MIIQISDIVQFQISHTKMFVNYLLKLYSLILMLPKFIIFNKYYDEFVML